MAHNRRNETEEQLLLLMESSDGSDESDLSESDTETEDMSEDENSADDDQGEIEWTEDVKNDLLTSSEDFVFGAGPVHDLPSGSTPLQFLKLFFTDDVCEAFQLNINRHADLEQKRRRSVDSHWKPIEDVLELWRFFGIVLICGIVRVPRLKDYWSTNDILGNQAVKRLMSRNRFQKILQYFHVGDGDNDELDNDDGSFTFSETVQSIVDDVRERFLKHFNPPRELLVNEAFIKNKISMGILQYLPLKPSRSGLKIWTLSSPTGYVFNFDLYTGKKARMERSKNGLGHDVVTRLLTPIGSRGHHIYLDRFFSSVPLIMDIYKDGNRACGSIRSDRKYMPKKMKNLQLKECGDHRHFQCIQCPDLLCSVWLDNEQHCVISTNSKMDFVEVKTRQGNHAIDVDCPSMIAEYNRYMGGVQRSLQTRNYSNRLTRSSKWWRYLFWFLFDSCLNNAFIVYTLTNMPQNRSPQRLLDFKLEVIEEILNFFVNSSLRNKSLNLQSSAPKPSKNSDSNPAPSSAFLHQKVKIKGRKQTCKRCSKMKRKTAANYYVQSSFMCDTCQICLCVSCFGIYHSENQMQFS